MKGVCHVKVQVKTPHDHYLLHASSFLCCGDIPAVFRVCVGYVFAAAAELESHFRYLCASLGSLQLRVLYIVVFPSVCLKCVVFSKNPVTIVTQKSRISHS